MYSIKNNTKNNKSQEKINYFQDEFSKQINEKANIWKNLKYNSVKTAKLLLNSEREREKRRGERMLHCGEFITYGINNDDFLKVAIKNNEEFEKINKMGKTLFNLEYETTIKTIEELTKTKEIKHHFKNAKFCKSRLCPICQWKKSLKKRAEMYKILPTIEKENKNLRFLFLTLTIKNCYMHNLKETINNLNSSLRKMLKDEKLRFIKGIIKSLEITQGKSEKGTAHPHLHLLIAVSSSFFKGYNYLKYEDWRNLWKEYLKTDYDPQINIQAIKKNTDIIRELLKTSLYIEKDTLEKFDEEIFLEYSRQIDNTRTYELTGIFKDYRKKIKQENTNIVIDDENGELVNLDMLINSIFVNFIEDTYKYKYDNNIINKFIKIANNHIRLIEELEKAKEQGLFEKEKEIEKEQSKEMFNIIKEFIEIADKKNITIKEELRNKIRINKNKTYDFINRLLKTTNKNLESYILNSLLKEEIEIYYKKKKDIKNNIINIKNNIK